MWCRFINIFLDELKQPCMIKKIQRLLRILRVVIHYFKLPEGMRANVLLPCQKLTLLTKNIIVASLSI